ncbi:MAG: TerB family tellurite resistance protein [Planctomycetota bacterium]
MADKQELVMALAKLMVAAAWADREIAGAEVNCLKDLLFRIPELDGRQWARLEIYMDSPVGEQERQRLLHELVKRISTEDDKRLAISMLEEVGTADGVLTEDEKAVIDEIKQEIEAAPVGLVGSLSKLLNRALGRRSQTLANVPNREDHFHDFIHNQVYYRLRQRLAKQPSELDLPEAKCRTLCAGGGLLARIAHVDEHVADEEFNVIVGAIQNNWDLAEEEAAFVAEVAVSEAARGMDLFRLSREFFEGTDHEQRKRFVVVLFEVAKAHDGRSEAETEEIRHIARMLRVPHGDFIEAKLK